MSSFPNGFFLLSLSYIHITYTADFAKAEPALKDLAIIMVSLKTGRLR